MSATVQGLFRRGATFSMGTTQTLTSTYGGSQNLEGHVGYFKDEAVSTGGIKTNRSDRVQKCIVVRNVSAGALLPKRVVSWASGYVGRRVDGYTTTTNAWAAGVVDERLPSSGVPRYDLFWLQVAGPCLCKTDIAALVSIAEGDRLVALTAATSGATTAGRVLGLIASTNATQAIAQISNQLGRALSAKTTGNTDADILVDLEIMSNV